MSERPRFLVELEALPDQASAERRLAGALKLLLRRFKLKCVKAEEVEEGSQGEGRQNPQGHNFGGGLDSPA